MARWRDQQRAVELFGALLEGGSRLIRRKPVDLSTFLAALDGVEPAALLTTADGRRDAHTHLLVTWEATVSAIARPETLPAVIERRSRTRVPPAAPWLSAGAAAAGSVAVVSGSQPVVVEGIAVVAVACATAVGSGWLWRPRTTRADRRFTVTGAPALTARARALAAQQSVGDPDALRATDRLLALAHGCAQDVEDSEAAARTAGLFDPGNQLNHNAQVSPAHRQLIDDMVLRRAELVRTVLHLQRAVLEVDEQDRRSRREEYRRIVDDLDE